MNEIKQTTFDYLVVGGGTAGIIAATRLSEKTDSTVLLLEAGLDYPETADIPSVLLNSNIPVTSGYNWSLQALRRQLCVDGQLARLARSAKVFELASSVLPQQKNSINLLLEKGMAFNQIDYPVAKVMGGGSAVNGALAMQARQCDFEDWEQRGNDLWGWQHIKSWIDKLTQNKLLMPIEIPRKEFYTKSQSAFLESCERLGFKLTDADAAFGVHPIPKNTLAGQRASTAEIYLKRARSRKNLTILSNCLVDRIMFNQGSSGIMAQSVEAIIDGKLHSFKAANVVLAAGAVHSPAILLRSGIGSFSALAQLGIPPIINAPGVGENLQDHPVVSLWAVPASASYEQGEPIHQLMLEHGSSRSDISDLQLLMLSAVPTAMFPPLGDMVSGGYASGISVMLAKPLSRGSVVLKYRDPNKSPEVSLNFLENSYDLQRMLEGVRLAWRIMSTQPLQDLMARHVMWNQRIIDSDELLSKAVLASVRTGWHPVGTLPMGAAHNKMAVVNQYGQLHGCHNVTVVDASIMPAIPGVPPNLTCMVIAERLASALAERGSSVAKSVI